MVLVHLSMAFFLSSVWLQSPFSPFPGNSLVVTGQSSVTSSLQDIITELSPHPHLHPKPLSHLIVITSNTPHKEFQGQIVSFPPLRASPVPVTPAPKCYPPPLSLLFTYFNRAAAAAKSRQSCPTLCDPIDGSPSGSPVPGILQARTLEWVAISFSNA